MLKKQFTLRQNQVTFTRELAFAVKQHRRVIGCAATGMGKSKTFLTIAANALKKSHTVLVITESRKIYKQLINEVHALEIIPGSNPPIAPGRIYLAMAQTLRRRKKLIQQFHAISLMEASGMNGLLIINDECHINEATSILEQLPNAMLIGFSGSPVGKHLVRLYNHLIVGPQPHELVLEGYLTPYKHFERKRAELSRLEVDSTGEFTQQSQTDVFSTDAVYEGIIEDLTDPRFKWSKAILFTSSIAHCMQTCERLQAAGLACVPVHSALGKNERTGNYIEDENLALWKYGDVRICVNVFILGKGFDYPPCDFVGLLIKTNSLPRYLQAIGRASRVLEEDVLLPLEQRKKKLFYCFDYGQNCTKHKPWDYAHDWQTLWRSKPKREGVSPIKVCPECDYVNDAGVKKCVNCGYEWLTFATPIEAPENIETILVEVNAKYNALIGKNIKELSPKELADYATSKGKQGFAQVVCKWHYKQGNPQFIKDFAKAMGYKPYWAKLAIDRYNEMTDEQKQQLEVKDVILK